MWVSVPEPVEYTDSHGDSLMGVLDQVDAVRHLSANHPYVKEQTFMWAKFFLLWESV